LVFAPKICSTYPLAAVQQHLTAKLLPLPPSSGIVSPQNNIDLDQRKRKTADERTQREKGATSKRPEEEIKPTARLYDAVSRRLCRCPRGGTGFSGLSEQYKKCRRGSVALATAATAATRAPSGAVSVPLPRTPSENMRSNTGRGEGHQRQFNKVII